MGAISEEKKKQLVDIKKIIIIISIQLYIKGKKIKILVYIEKNLLVYIFFIFYESVVLLIRYMWSICDVF